MNLDENQVAELVSGVEEELRELDQFTNVGVSEVCLFQINGYDLYIKLVSTDYQNDEDEDS